MFSLGPKDPTYYINKRDLFSNWNWFKSINPIYLKTCLFFGSTLSDRTGTLQSGYDFKIIDSIPKVEGFKLRFEDICIKRAEEITSRSQGPLKILWSGGIDSTVALISLIKVLRSKNEISRLVV